MLCRANTGGEALEGGTRQLKPLRWSDAQCATRSGITRALVPLLGRFEGSGRATGFADGRWLMRWREMEIAAGGWPRMFRGGDLTLLPRGVPEMNEGARVQNVGIAPGQRGRGRPSAALHPEHSGWGCD